MATFRLEWAIPAEKNEPAGKIPEIDDKMLLTYVLWFIRVRWIVIFIFIVSGVSGLFFFINYIKWGFSLPAFPLLVMALMLSIINSVYYLQSRKLSLENHREISVALWVQIIVDLLFVTALVYFVGSSNTYIPFIYLIHIALSCIFYSRSKSIIVVSISAFLYMSCIILQCIGILEEKSIIISGVQSNDFTPLVRILFALSAIFIWYVLWYFISTLSVGIREREASLKIKNEELKQADREKTKKVIVTTHDLKAPFVGIESNINVLKYLHWDDLPDTFQTILNKIEIRSKTLRARIDKILELGNLRIQQENIIAISPVKLKNIFDDVIGELADQILDKKITLSTEILDLKVNSNEDKLKSLFSNLLSNAIFYTGENGEIEVKMINRNGLIQFVFKDTGIGIAEKYLDKIFDEYFRTPEAAKYNKMSSGLGLQIVKTIIKQLQLNLEVQSELGEGTIFIVEMNQKAEV